MTMTPLDKKSFWILALCLVVSSLLIYWPNPRMGYVLDDHYVIARNPAVKDPSLTRILTSGLFDSAQRKTDSHLNYYRPLLTASFAADQYLFGSQPFAQRLVNLLIHVLNCVLVFGFLYLLFGNVQRAGLAAILFCILPVHEWSVRYIVGRGDLLSTLFSLGSLIALLCYIQKNIKPWLWLSTLLFVCALLSKESAILNIVYVLMTAWFIIRQGRRVVIITAFFAVIAAAYYILRSNFFPINTGAAFGLADLTGGLTAGFIYILRLWMPAFGSSVISYAPVISLIWVVSSIGLLISSLKSSSVGSGRRRECIFGLLWVGIGLAQYVVVVRVIGRLGPVLSEHFLYFQAVGFVLVLAVMIDGIGRQFLRKAVFTALVFFYVSFSILSGLYWISEEDLLRHVQNLEGRPYTVAHEQLVMRFDPDEHAVLEFITRAQSASGKSVWYRRLGDIYHKRRDYPRAMDALSRAVTLNPINTEALNQWAVCYLETGEAIKGLQLLKRSIDADPGQSDAYRLSGVYFYRVGQFADAVPYFKKALEADPGQAESSLHLMMAYYFMDDQNSYLQAIDSVHSIDQRVMLSFAAQEFYSHGFFAQTVKVIEQSMSLFANDPVMKALAQDARLRMESLSK